MADEVSYLALIAKDLNREKAETRELERVHAKKKARLVGYDNFVRTNPRSDRFDVICFHHVEFIVGDALNTAMRFASALGMEMIASSNQHTGNHQYASHVIASGSVRMGFSAPYADRVAADSVASNAEEIRTCNAADIITCSRTL